MFTTHGKTYEYEKKLILHKYRGDLLHGEKMNDINSSCIINNCNTNKIVRYMPFDPHINII